MKEKTEEDHRTKEDPHHPRHGVVLGKLAAGGIELVELHMVAALLPLANEAEEDHVGDDEDEVLDGTENHKVLYRLERLVVVGT